MNCIAATADIKRARAHSLWRLKTLCVHRLDASYNSEKLISSSMQIEEGSV